jgi:hypothetical protein
MRAVTQSDAADEQQHRHPTEVAAEELIPREREQIQRQPEQQARGEPRRIVGGKQSGPELAGHRRQCVNERRPVDERLAREIGREEVAPLQHFVDDAERGRILRLPRVVPDEPEHHPCAAQQDEPELLQRAIRARRAQYRVGGGSSGCVGGKAGHGLFGRRAMSLITPAQSLKKKAAEAAFSALGHRPGLARALSRFFARVASVLGGGRLRRGRLCGRRRFRGGGGLGGVALTELVDATRGVHHLRLPV